MTEWMSTRRQRVEAHLSDRRILAGEIYLQTVARHHSGPETPTDFLNRTDHFFALTLEGEAPVFVAKTQLLYLKMAPDAAEADPDRAQAARRLELEVELSDGTLLEGIVMIELPPDRLRALDFLNSTESFFPLLTDDAVRILNRDHIRAASPLVDIKRGSA